MNFKVVGGVETVELTAAERRALEKAATILETLGRKADDATLRASAKGGAERIEGVLGMLYGLGAETE